MLRRAYFINLVASALGTVLCYALMPAQSEVLKSLRRSFDAAALNSALLSPVVYRTVTVYSR